jgi:hypothetical protein
MSCSLEYGHLSVAAVVMTMVAKVGFAHDSTASELFLIAQGKLMPPILMPKTLLHPFILRLVCVTQVLDPMVACTSMCHIEILLTMHTATTSTSSWLQPFSNTPMSP